MRASYMVEGQLYRLKDGTIVEFARFGAHNLVIVHPPGEPDLQSCFGIYPWAEVEEVTEVAER